MKARLLILLWLFGLTVGAMADDDRIWIEATINDKPARFVFDTGAPNYFVLYRKGAERLGVIVTNTPSDSEGFNGYTGMCSMRIGEDSLTTSFWVFDWPTFGNVSGDGLIGWLSVTNCVTMIDAKAQMVQLFSAVPMDTRGWVKFGVQTNCPVLRLILPKQKGKESVLLIDTGTDTGVKLNSAEWRRWKLSHKHEPTTLADGYEPGAGINVSEEQLAKEITFGPLTLTDVPVMEANSTDVALGGKGYDATLGFAALKRVDFIVDALHNVAYLRPKNEIPPPFRHNRAGAVFAPRDSQCNDLIAHVIRDGPAYAAGIRDGDLLLEFDGRSVQNWRNEPALKQNVNERPAGTINTFTLKRGKKIFKATVVLEDILVPGR